LRRLEGSRTFKITQIVNTGAYQERELELNVHDERKEGEFEASYIDCEKAEEK